MASTEERAYEIMRELDVSYVLVIFGGLTGYSSDGMFQVPPHQTGQLSQKNEALISLRIVSFTVILVQNKCTTQGRGVHLVIHTTREKCLYMWRGRTHSHSFSIATHAYKTQVC